MGWLIAAAVLAALAILPLGISAKYDSGGPQVKVIAGPVRILIFPRKKRGKKPEKPKEEPKTPAESKKSTGETETPKKNGGSLTAFFPLVEVVMDFLGDFRRKLRVNRMELKLILAGDDPCDLALNYGRAWTALGNLMPHLERLFVIKKRDLEVECDFTADTTTVYARLDLTITLGRLLCLAVRYGIRTLKEYMKIQNQRKGGAVS